MIQCSRLVLHKSYSSLTPLVANQATQHSQPGRLRRSQKVCLDSSDRDLLAAITSPQGVTIQRSKLTTGNAALVGELSETCNNEGALLSVNPNAFVFGIDPDVSGAMAVLHCSTSGNDNNTAIAEVFDLPSVRVMVGSGYRRRHDPQSLVTMIRDLKAPAGSVAYLEQSSPLPKDGKQGWWGSGFGYGVWIGTLFALGISVVPVRSVTWKRALGLAGKAFTKDDCRAVASLMFPSLAPQLRRKKDHGRAEALLIAAYGKGLPVPTDCTLDKATLSQEPSCH